MTRLVARCPLYSVRVDKPGFIIPPPNLVPPRHDTQTQTQRAPARGRELPVFLPASAGAPTEPDVGEAIATPEATPTGPAPAAAGWQLGLPDGVVIPVTGALLLGRDPVRFGAWTTAVLIALEDPEKSVSKTHAALEQKGDGLQVTDLHSTNGVFLTGTAGAEIALEPGESTTITADCSVQLGRYTILVYQARVPVLP